MFKNYLIPRKIKYWVERKEFGEASVTDCPFGGAIEKGDYFKKGIHWKNAKVGSDACGNCLYNKGTYFLYVRCKRKR